MPPAAAAGIGASATVQCRPPSREWNTRAAPPPAGEPGVAAAVRHQAGAAGGERELARDSRRHARRRQHVPGLRPPSSVAAIRNFPSTGSLNARPRLPSAKKSMQS